MTKINFRNGQSPYINAQNLNQLQNNVEAEIGNINTVLDEINGEVV